MGASIKLRVASWLEQCMAQGVGGSNPSRPTNAKKNNTDCRRIDCNNDGCCSRYSSVYLRETSRYHTSKRSAERLLSCRLCVLIKCFFL